MTGCEALYADMGHFGKAPIRWAWLYFAFPALMLNYFGQGALLLSQPGKASLPVLRLAPHWAHYPMVPLATVATIIAIAGGDHRRLFDHPPGGAAGPAAAHGNPPHLGDRSRPDLCAAHERRCWRVGVVLIVLIFKSSDALAAAYGIAVTGVMVISHRPGRHGGGYAMALEAARWSSGVRRPGPDRSGLPVLQCAQDRAKAAGCRWRWRPASSW